MSAAGMAERLNQGGFRPPRLGRDEYRLGSLARRLGISRDTVRRWVKAGWLTSSRDASGRHVIWADASELKRLRELHGLTRTWATRDRLAELTKPKPRPER